jgi:3' terminal RNA ribose 2'-O-methyltransferase Hen1
MLLLLTTTHRPATDLGFLLHKHPQRLHHAEMPFGQVHIFFPEASEDRCTAAVLLDVNSVELVRRRSGPEGEAGLFARYVNDRPYVTSSFLSVALARALGSALKGQCKDRPDLVKTPIPLQLTLSVLPCRGGEDFLRRIFEPLGYQVSARAMPLDAKFPEWGPSQYFEVTLSAEKTLSEALGHLYVLVPVLDDEKHYWVTDDEADKLFRYGEAWLHGHPERETIIRRYLKHQRSLVRDAIERLEETGSGDDEAEVVISAEEAKLERSMGLNEQRLEKVFAVLKDSGAKRVLDLGCGEGRLLQMLLADPQFEEILGLEVSWRSLERASSRLKLDRLAPRQREKLKLLHGSLTYRDQRLAGFDAAAVVEVIEHLDPPRLTAFERVLFENARPSVVVVTTPNAEYNVKWERLPTGQFRHRDHRFEWSRSQFQSWGTAVAERFKYTVRFDTVGPVDSNVGSPTQMGVFSA